MGQRIGWVRCTACGYVDAAVSENATGTLSVKCHKCEFSSFAKKGTLAARKIRADLRPDDNPESQPPGDKPVPEGSEPKLTPIAAGIRKNFAFGEL